MNQAHPRNGVEAAENDCVVRMSRDERLHVIALSLRHGLTLGLLATLAWSVFWIALTDHSWAWCLLVLPVSWALGFAFARFMLQRQTDDELRRRSKLLKFAREYQANKPLQPSERSTQCP
jgi:hypothetical protein